MTPEEIVSYKLLDKSEEYNEDITYHVGDYIYVEDNKQFGKITNLFTYETFKFADITQFMRHERDYETAIFKINKNCSTTTALVALQNISPPLVIGYEHDEIWFVGKPCELSEFEWLTNHLL